MCWLLSRNITFPYPVNLSWYKIGHIPSPARLLKLSKIKLILKLCILSTEIHYALIHIQWQNVLHNSPNNNSFHYYYNNWISWYSAHSRSITQRLHLCNFTIKLHHKIHHEYSWVKMSEFIWQCEFITFARTHTRNADLYAEMYCGINDIWCNNYCTVGMKWVQMDFLTGVQYYAQT